MTTRDAPLGLDWVLPAETQAQRIVGKLGGIERVAKLLRRYDPKRKTPWAGATVHSWLARGTVSPDAVPALQTIANELDIKLTVEDWLPVTYPGRTMVYVVGEGWRYQNV